MSADSRDANSMDQVRELLFGAQVKEIEEHLKKQEAHIMRELAALRDEVRAVMLELETALSDRMEAEAGERSANKSESDKRLAELKAGLEERSATLSAALNKSEMSLKALINSENMRITSTVEKHYKSALSSLSESTAQIRRDMVDRGAISALFAELAGKFAPDAGPALDKKE